MGQSRTVRAVHPNAGLRARYRRAMVAMIRRMAVSVEAWVLEQRRIDPPVLAQDESPSARMQRDFGAIAAKWQKHFDDLAPTVAENFLKNQFRGTDAAFRQALLDAGWAIEFVLTPAMRDAFEASLAENVGLIRSIPQQYLREVEGIVMRNYAAGRDVKSMAREIRGRFKVTSNRAWLIARDQSNKANSVVQKARMMELGITEAIWMHSYAGREPRPTHEAMNNKRYKIAEGMYDSAVKYNVWPGSLINCRCLSRAVLPWTPAATTTADNANPHSR